MKNAPALTPAQLLEVPSRVGVPCVAIVSPTPSWPRLLSPQQYRDPDVRMPHVWVEPVLTLAQLVEAPTRVGVLRLVLSSSPS